MANDGAEQVTVSAKSTQNDVFHTNFEVRQRQENIVPQDMVFM